MLYGALSCLEHAPLVPFSGQTDGLVCSGQVNQLVLRLVCWLVSWLASSGPVGPGTTMVQELLSGPPVVTCVHSSTATGALR